jgi:bacillithiol system protein YtxJ
MNWIELTSAEELTALVEKSYHSPQVIFKHSTRCNISSVVLRRLEKEDEIATINFYYLDLIRYRSLSNKIAEQFQVHHESPQVLVIKNGECRYDESHMAIQMDDILEQAAL